MYFKGKIWLLFSVSHVILIVHGQKSKKDGGVTKPVMVSFVMAGLVVV